jgi:hypothetical protein
VFLVCARSAITAYLDASDGNIRAAQSLSHQANLNTLNRYDGNLPKYQAVATNMLADLVEIYPSLEDYISFPPLDIGVDLWAFRSKTSKFRNRL